MVKWESSQNREGLIEFLDKWKDETDPSVSLLPGGVEGTVDMLIDKGEVVVGLDNEQVVSLCGYTFGEPDNNFDNTSIGYVYVAITDPKCRGKFFREGFREVVNRMKSKRISEMRFKANSKDDRMNNFYRKFAEDKGLCLNSGGFPSRLYSLDLSDMH